jgi:hypothetical protein
MGIRTYEERPRFVRSQWNHHKNLRGGNLVGSAMDRTENQESPASPARIRSAAADRIRELKPNADGKYRKIIDIITDLHALIAVYQGIKSKLIKKEGLTNGRPIFQ